MKARSSYLQGQTVAVLAASALFLACQARDLPGDTDPRQPWAESSSPAPSSAPTPVVRLVDDKLFEVEAVMRHQHALGITADQKAGMLRELDAAQAEFNHLEWDLNGEKERLAATLTPERVDEQAALEAAKRVTDLEGKLKLAHMRLLVRIKNQLTGDQQTKLRKLTR
jgi:hypothetical protein